jgi:hypothetical protein
VLIFAGCAVVRVEKRLHRKGFHFSNTSKPEKNSASFEEKQTRGVTSTPHTKYDSSESYNLFVFEIQDECSFPTEEPSKRKQSSSISSLDYAHNQESIYQPIESQQFFSSIESFSSEGEGLKESNEQQSPSAFWYFLLLFTTPIAFVFRDTEKMSKWALRNPRRAKWIIAICITAALLISFALGAMLNFFFAPWMAMLSIGISILSLVMYFFITRTNQKGWFGWELNSRQEYRAKVLTYNAFNVSCGFGSFALGSMGLWDGRTSWRDWSAVDGFLSADVMTIKSSTSGALPMSNGVAFLLIFLLILTLIGIAFLSCVLLCSESFGLALLVLVGLTPITIFTFVKLFRLHKEYRKLHFLNYYGEIDEEKRKKVKQKIGRLMLKALLFFGLILVCIVLIAFFALTVLM